MKISLSIAILALLGTLFLSATPAAGQGAMRVEDALWAGGVTWDTVLTPTSFKSPPHHSVDLLYDFGMSGLEGQRGVSESYPGQQDYNGGRWWVRMVVFTPEGIEAHDADGDGMVDFELMSAEEVLEHEGLGHLEILETATYFVCPLLRSK